MTPLPRIAAIDELPLDATFKGYPGTEPPLRVGQVAARGWNLLREDLPLPAAVLKASALSHNRAWMRAYLARTGAVLCPHGKTTMSPQLFAAQLEDGAFGITCATAGQLPVYRRYGIQRVLMANQVVGGRAIAYVMAELGRDPAFELYLLVDSVDGVRRLASAARAAGLGRPLRLLVEVGANGARTGTRSMTDFEAVLGAVEAAGPGVRLHGVEAYEGVVEAADGPREAAIEALLDFQLAASTRARRSRAAATPWLLSAGGSSYFDLVAQRLGAHVRDAGALLVLRSGCYLTHDHGTYAQAQAERTRRDATVAGLGEGFRAALEVWTHVQSRPEAARAYLTAGKRDLSYDVDLPRPLAWYRPGRHARPEPLDAAHRIVKLNDQHAHLALPERSPLAVGDLVALGISHPCTAFERWPLLYLVDDAYTVIDAVRTFF